MVVASAEQDGERTAERGEEGLFMARIHVVPGKLDFPGKALGPLLRLNPAGRFVQRKG